MNHTPTQQPSFADIDELLTLFSQGNYRATETRAKELIARFPEHGFGWKVLGVALRQQGQIAPSLLPMQKAAELLPHDAEAHSNLGVTLMNQGRLDDAVISYRHALALNPDYIDVHHHLGLTLMTLGHWSEAEVSFRHVLNAQPNHSDVHSHLASVLHWQGHYSEAESHYQQALALNPLDIKAYSSLGLLLQAQGRLTEARDCYQCVLEINPQFAEIHNNLGIVFHELGLDSEAEACYNRALAINPNNVEALNNMGLTLQRQGRLAKAEAAYRHALAIDASNAEAQNNLGIIFQQRGQLLEALASYQSALVIKPNDAEIHNNLGAIYKDLGRMSQAETSFRRALAIKPDYTEARSNLLFIMNYYSTHSAVDYLAEAQRYGLSVKNKVTSSFTTWYCQQHPERLRIGLVLGDLHHHEIGLFLAQLLPELDGSCVEVYAYPTHPKSDELTVRLQNCFSAWQSLIGLSDSAAARLIHADGIHILFDLSGHNNYNRLPVFAWKPAPVQVNWLGFLATTGLAEMDYVLGDTYVTPLEESAIFSESVWQLPDAYRCFTVPDIQLTVNSLPTLSNNIITFANFNALTHINEAVLSLWARILHTVPQSRLLLKTPQLNNETARQILCEQFADLGILPERLLLESDNATLTTYHRVDIILDTFPYNGATSSVHALWMGVPVLTLSGDRFTARRGASILANAELSDWIAFDDNDYVSKAVQFATDTHYLVALRMSLRQQLLASPLVDTVSFARHFEAALWSMYKTH